MHQEKGFILKKVKDFGLPAELSSVIEVHRWKKIASHPQDPVVPLVREFYSNILTSAQTFSMVRGGKVSFSASIINMHWGLDDVDDDYVPLLVSISINELNLILSSMTIEGTTWLPDKGDVIFMCARPALCPIAKIWYHFIRTRLIPTTHVETVN